MNYYRLDQVCEINPKKEISSALNGEISFIPMDAVSTDGKIDTSRTISTKDIKNYTVFRDGDVLFAKITPCMENGKGAITAGLKNGCGAGSTEFIVLRPDTEKISQKWLYLFLSQKSFRLYCQQNMMGSAGQKRVPSKFLAACVLPVPALKKQEQIITRIEELFSQLGSGVETLEKVKQQLAVYRQAVLKEAFDTALHDCQMLSIEQFLTKDRKGMSTGPFGTMIKKQDHKTYGVPMLGIENIGRGQFVDGNKIFVTPKKAEELWAFVLKEGDIIISRSGTVGEICAVPQRTEGALLSTNLMRISLDNSIIRSDYFISLFQSKGVVLDQIKELCKGSTRDFLNQTILKQIVFPVPSLETQERIVNDIDAKMSVCDSIEQTVDTALQQAEAMRQSILKQAFEGGL